MSESKTRFDLATDDSSRPNESRLLRSDPMSNEAISRPADRPPQRFGSWHRFGLSRGDQVFVAFFVAVVLVLMFVYWLRIGGWRMQPVEIERLEPRESVFVVDINRATWVEWAQLEGIGPALAHRIVADRDENGPFRSVDELARVPGIGRKRLEQLRPWLLVNAEQFVEQARHEDN
jgi:competence protein ComEA